MKKIGILSFFGVHNVGAYAQAYALNNYIRNMKSDIQVVHINYLHDKHKEMYGIGDENTSQINKDSEIMFSKYYNLIPNIQIKNPNELTHLDLDCLILGSDMIWDFSIVSYGEDPFLFGLGFNTKYKFSYAPSFGTCKPEWKRIPSYVIEGLKDLNDISVRDRKSVQIVRNIADRDASLVLDPIWLWDWNSDEKITAHIEQFSKPFIFVYGEGFDEGFIKSLVEYAHTRELTIIAHGSAEFDFSWCDEVLDTSSVTPFEVICYFKNAACVATNTFHGVMFALYFEKRMAYFINRFVDNKVKDFLEDLGIYDKFTRSDCVGKILDSEWNYDAIKLIIDKKKQNSINFINKNLIDFSDNKQMGKL